MNGFCGEQKMLRSGRINRRIKYLLASWFVLHSAYIWSLEMYQDIL